MTRASGVPSPADTIVAQASGFGRAALGVVRISGPRSRAVVETIAGALPPARMVSLKSLREPHGEILDRALVTWFPGPASFSGEDMAEVSVHGGLAVMAAVLRAILAVPGVRLAEPGEFTRRAVLNGKLDLAAAEALGDLIDAETQAQRRQAMRHLDGALGDAIARWREELLMALALVEADLDFSDEGDVAGDGVAAALLNARAVEAELGRALADHSGERLREGFTVVIAGPPNAGKSTLLNHLAKREVAIVSPHAGTTRDAIEVRCEIGGLPVLLVDTAGLRPSADPVEREGVRRTRTRIDDADLVLWLESIDSVAEQTPEGEGSLRVTTKADLDAGRCWAAGQLAVSAVTGRGVSALLDAIRQRAAEAMAAETSLITRERHREAFAAARTALRCAIDSPTKPTDLLAEDLRGATRALGTITGHVGAEDVLDRIFSSFCIGK